MSICVWLSGLSGAGKTTLANLLSKKFNSKGFKTCVLDGDILRNGLNKDLCFTDKDRHENNRRVSEIAKLLVDQDILVFVALISPFESDRVLAKNLFNRNCFVEVFLDAPIDVCISRDVKGLYAQHKLGLVENMTGITSVYEPPSNPDIYLRTDRMNEPQCIEVISTYLEKLLLLQFN
jgi:adenylyl-sulfate kinase